MPDRRTSRISVLLDQQEYERFSAYCLEKGFKKSTLVARLIRDHLDSEAFRLQRRLPLERPNAGAGRE